MGAGDRLGEWELYLSGFSRHAGFVSKRRTGMAWREAHETTASTYHPHPSKFRATCVSNFDEAYRIPAYLYPVDVLAFALRF